MSNRLLVTGVTGFLGRHLVRALGSRGFENFEAVSWDQSTMGSLLSAERRGVVLDVLQPDAVLHLAWSSTRAENYEKSPENSDWGRESSSFLLECVHRGTWFIAIGSAADTPDDDNFASPYSEAKREFRIVADELMASSQISWIRPQFVVSIEDERPRVVLACLRAGAGTEVELRSPDSELDFVHVSDVADGIIRVVDSRLTGTIELGSGYLHSVAELAAAVGRHTNPTEPGRCRTARRPSPTRPEALLRTGWRPVRTEAFFGD